jgi:AraC-like DNA-binding protein
LKRFARIARIEKVMAGCRKGLDWLDIAYGCGFCDQSHMIRDFKEIIGQPPREFFRTLAGPQLFVGGSNSTFAVTEALAERCKSLSRGTPISWISVDAPMNGVAPDLSAGQAWREPARRAHSPSGL